MIFGLVTSSPRGDLSLQQSLELANVYLDYAEKTRDSVIAKVLCHDAEVSLFQAKKGAKHAEDKALQQGIGVAYIGLGKLLDKQRLSKEAKAIYKKAEKLGVKVQDHDQHAQPADTKSIAPSSIKGTVDSVVDTPLVKGQPIPPTKNKKPNDTATVPAHIFAENVRPPMVVAKLPEPDERLISTPQLACCLGLLSDSHELDDILEPIARNWLQVVENDEDEHERLKILSLDVIRTFKKEEIKDAKAVAEVVCLAPVIERDIFRDLLKSFYDGIDHSGLLDIHQLQGLAQLIQGADTGYLDADDLVKILGLLATRLKETHQQSPQHIYQLTLAASYVLDAMADTKVEGLDRETLHEPLSSYMDALKGNSEPYLMYQAAYACQALLCVPDNESLWQATVRRTGKVVQGVSGLVSAVKGLDLNGFMDGLKDIQQGIAGASEMVQIAVTALDGVKSMAEGGQGFLEGLKEGLSFKRKCAWYSALRGADTLIRDGEFASFKTLACEAPCRMDPAFQWGVCQRLGEVASNPNWDSRTRRSAVAFLGEMYRNEEEWGDQASIKEWIIVILIKSSSSVGGAQQYIETLLQELETISDDKGKARLQAAREKGAGSYPLKLALPPLASPSLLDRVQNKPDVEGTLRQLRKHRLKERGNAVYIHPQAKASLNDPDDQRFPLMEKVNEFLDSNQKVFLLLGDSGAGKSTFNRQLEYELWNNYKKATGIIPLFITLPAIDKPEQDLIAKQLRKSEFTESELRELKMHRKFILICDGYDESQQTHNLYMSNRLNQPGEWNAQMVISCRSEYLGVSYRDRFQPGDRNSISDPGQLLEAVITPFTPDQVHDYVKQYVLVRQPLWEVKEYEQALHSIPGLKDLVKNPFLMTLSLEVLPRMIDPGEHLSVTHVTRVALYDQFIEHWLERGKKRLSEKEMSPQSKAAFESLIDEGFTQNGIDFLKRLTVAIYKEQDGQPIVSYSRFKDEGTWKAPFFSREDEKQLLCEACPLLRSGNQHRFVHRSLLEYGLALAIFDPRDWKEKPMPVSVSNRRGSTSSTYSFRQHGSTKDVTAPDQDLDSNSPLVWRYFTDEPSILQFLSERAQQEPIFRKQLHGCIERSKSDKKWRIAAANAITILIKAGVQFNHANLRGIQIPGADLSDGLFESAQLQDADLRQVSLRGTWLQQADLSRAHMSGVQFGELPYLAVEGQIYCCVYSPDGNSLTLSFDTGEIRVYSTSTWELTQTLAGHDGLVRAVTYSPKGDQIASCSQDSTLRLWETESGTCTHIMTGHVNEVTSVAYSPRGDAIASAGDDATVRLWDVATGDCRLVLTGHSEYALRTVFSPNGHNVASGGGGDFAVRLWDVETGACLRLLSGHSNLVWAVAYSPQGDRVVSGASDNTVRIWDVESGICCRVLTGHTNEIVDVVYSPQGDVIATASSDYTVRLWDVETESCRQILNGHSNFVRSVVFSPKKDRITSVGQDGTVRFWDVGSGVSRQVSTNHYGRVTTIEISAQGDEVVSCGCDASVRIWDVETGTCSRILSGHLDYVKDTVCSPRGDLFACTDYESTVRLWDAVSGDPRYSLVGHTGDMSTIVFSPQGDQIASGDDQGVVKVWDLETGACRHTFNGHTNTVTNIVYSPKRNQLATGSNDCTVRLWSLESGVCLHTLRCDKEVSSFSYSPQGHHLVSASEDQVLRVWDVESGDCGRILLGHAVDMYIGIIMYSPQGDRFASADSSGLVKIWDMETGECRHSLDGHTDRLTGIVFSPKGHVITGSYDETVHVWDAASGQCRFVVQTFGCPVTSIAWSTRPDVDCFVTGCRDGTVRMWQVVEEEEGCHVRLLWGSMNGELEVKGASIQGVRGLSQLNEQLLKQRGAVGEPCVRLCQASKKLIGMASVVSTLKKTSGKTVQDLTPSASHFVEQSEQTEEPESENSD